MPLFVEHSGRVTAGIPSLSPDRRAVTDYRGRQREKTRWAHNDAKAKAEATLASDGERPTTILESQLGRPLHSSEIVKRLLKINPRLYFEPSLSNHEIMGAYLIEPNANPDNPVAKYKHLRHLFGFERGISPEFSVRKTRKVQRWDEDKQRTVEVEEFSGEVRGWRTILARLIRKGYISEASAHDAFGSPSRDSANWQRLTQ